MLCGMRLQSKGSAQDNKRSGHPQKLTGEAAVEAAALLRAPESHRSYLHSGYDSVQDACMRCRALRVDAAAFRSQAPRAVPPAPPAVAWASATGPVQLLLCPAVPPTLHTPCYRLI